MTVPTTPASRTRLGFTREIGRRIATSRVLPVALLAGCLVAAVSGCTSSPIGPSTPVAVTLGYHASIDVGDAHLTFADVISDSRCPIYATCSQAGDVVVAIRISVRGTAATYDLALVDPTSNSVVHQGYRVTLQKVDPYPVSFRPGIVETYQVTLLVGR